MVKTILSIVTMVAIACVLCSGGVALGDDFVWDAVSLQPSWLNANDWDLDSSYPQTFSDNVTIDAASNPCTFDPGVDMGGEPVLVFSNTVTLAGASPTKRTLHIKDGFLVAIELILQDYAEMDVDGAATFLEKTTISDNVWVDVADGATLTLLATPEGAKAIHIDTAQARLNMTTTGDGAFVVEGVLIDADAAGASRTLKVGGTGTLTMIYGTGGGEFEIVSDPDADDNRAKLWLASGTYNMGPGAYLKMVGGASNARRAELDLDVDLTMTSGGFYEQGKLEINGYATIDVAANKTLCATRLIVGDHLGSLASLATLRAGSGASLQANTATCP